MECSLLGGVLADAQHLPHGRCQAGTATQIPRDPGQPHARRWELKRPHYRLFACSATRASSVSWTGWSDVWAWDLRRRRVWLDVLRFGLGM